MIRFLLDGEEVSLDDCAADTTILSYLRNERRLTGTKEGCASGDCGACTVVVASASDSDDELAYRPVNACIAPVGSLHGTQLITVEALRSDETLHPVQQALVDAHGSQCGFCTPGFVMSLFALHKRCAGRDVMRQEILEALGGNLCRCTGYRPIVDAAQAVLREPDRDRFRETADATLERLRAIREADAHGAALQTEGGAFHRPQTVADLVALRAAHPGARLVAGATDLMLEVTQALKSLPVLIDVTAVAELRAVHCGSTHISIGAAVTHSAAKEAVLSEYPELAELIERFGSLQIRSQGTVVGNIANASPIGDWPPVLLALGASLTLEGPRGQRQLPIDEFFLAYRQTALQAEEFIRSVEIPRRDAHLFLRAYKISKRYEDDISSLCAVFALDMDSGSVTRARCAFGGMAAVPARARGCEVALTGGSLDAQRIDAAVAALGQDFAPISDARASAAYRADAAGALLQRLALEASGSSATRAHPVEHTGREVRHG